MPRIAAARNIDGRIQVFYRGTDNALWYVSQTAANSSTWTKPASLSGYIISDPAVGINADGRLQVFVRGSDWALYHQWQNAPGSSDGRLDVFVRGTDNAVWHVTQNTPNTLFDWKWEGLSGSLEGSHPYNTPVAAVAHDGRLQVFVHWSDNTLRTMIQNTLNGIFKVDGWHNLGGPVTATIHPPVRGTTGLFYMFGRGGTGTNLMLNWQMGVHFLHWSGFVYLGDDVLSF